MAHIIANATARPGLDAAATTAGTCGLDLIEAIIREVEAEPEVHSVGRGGWPNMAGVVELDASIMNGATLEAGSVCALEGYLHPISIAREVMDRLPHVMLAGSGACRFAREIGAESAELLTEDAAIAYRDWIARHVPEELRKGWPDVDLSPYAKRALDPDKIHGTTCALVRDDFGNLACGVSTSGWAWKYPGRIGDSPIIGAGCYADNRYGAVGCIGTGEMAIRASTARSVILYMKQGMTVYEACHEAAGDYRDLSGGVLRSVTIHAMDAAGTPYVLTVGSDTQTVYYEWDDSHNRFESRLSESVSL